MLRASAERAAAALPWVLLAGALVRVGAAAWDGSSYSVDSWTYWELARSTGSGFYETDTVRNFQFAEPHGSSFPPVWPLLVAGIDALSGLDWRSGLAGALVAVVASALLAEAFLRRVAGVAGLGPLALLALLAFAPFREEVAAGRSFPLALAFLLVALLALTRQSLLVAGVLGVALALLALTRTDALVLALALPVLALAPAGRRALAPLAVCYGAVAALVAPWAAWTWSRLGEPLASDNSRVALSTETHFVLDRFPGEEATLSSDPAGWLERVVDNLPFLGDVLVRAGESALPLAPLLVAAAVGLALGRRRSRLPEWPLVATAVLVAVLAAVPALVLRYGDERYLSLVLAVAVLWLCALVALPRPPVRSALVIAAALILAVGAGSAAPAPGEPVAAGKAARTALAHCTQGSTGLLVLGDDTFAASVGALEGKRVLLAPSNLAALTSREVEALLAEFRVDRVYATQPGLARLVPALRRDGCLPGLYRA
jgi:hypothetical protein